MKKTKGLSKMKSEVVLSTKSEAGFYSTEELVTPLDVLHIKVLNLEIPDGESKRFYLNAVFDNHLLVYGPIICSDNNKVSNIILQGEMKYDPSDYHKMGLLSDSPLTVTIEAIKSLSDSHLKRTSSEKQSSLNRMGSSKSKRKIYCCNIDILHIFTDTDKLTIKKRMELSPMKSVLNAKSWNNLPLITLELNVQRNQENDSFHKILRDTNLMKVTIVGCYNMKCPLDEESNYMSATNLPRCNEQVCDPVTFNNGNKPAKKFDSANFIPHWESVRSSDNSFTKGDEQFRWKPEEILNNENFDLEYYMKTVPDYSMVLWASYHRTLITRDCEYWLSDLIRRYRWPLEVHVSVGSETSTFMACLDLLKLLYPGEKTIRLVAPMKWMDTEVMMEKCGCDPLLISYDKTSGIGTVQKSSRGTTGSAPSGNTMAALLPTTTGNDDNDAFVMIEISLNRPLKEPSIPPHVAGSELREILNNMKNTVHKRKNTGRRHIARDWQETVRQAANALRTVPYHGQIDMCTLARQLNMTRTRVELETSFWQEAAKYANNNFVLDEFLQSNDAFEEMIIMTHACLMRVAKETLTAPLTSQECRPIVRAARQARQLQHIPHALNLYLQMVAENKRDANGWRELSTCLKEIDNDWAIACINKSIKLYPRHPLSLLSKAGLIFDRSPDDAEPLLVALLDLQPFWPPAWAAVSAYYYHRELYDTAEQIMDCIKSSIAAGVSEQIKFPRAWNHELGDWWDQTPIQPGVSLYYDAADLLLRIRCISFAEVCVARALVEVGTSPMYYHLLGLCCRLRGDVENALCHLKKACELFPDISYLKSLEGECHYKKGNLTAAKECFNKCASYSGSFNTLLSLSSSLAKREPHHTRAALIDLLRRQPSAYAWMTFAEFWLAKSAAAGGGDAGKSVELDSATNYAVACAEQALKWDHRCGSAWALLSRLVKPSARRLYCQHMASMITTCVPVRAQGTSPTSHCTLVHTRAARTTTCNHRCDYRMSEEDVEHSSDSQQSLCYRLGEEIEDCLCDYTDL